MLQCATVFSRESAATNSVELNTASDEALSSGATSLAQVQFDGVALLRHPAWSSKDGRHGVIWGQVCPLALERRTRHESS
jgi:hypothetical protein